MRQTRNRTMVAVALMGGMAAVAACGDDTPDVVSIAVTPSAGTVRSGATVQYTATPMDNGGNPISGVTVTWMSGDAAIATVDGNGLVTGVGNGSALITASSGSVSGTALATSWIGVTGAWSGSVIAGSPCSMTMSITENASGAITGTGTLNDPTDACIDGTYTIAGNNDVGMVPDSVFLAWTGASGNTVPIDMAGNFDGTGDYSGTMGNGCVGCPIQFTRGSVVPTVRAPAMAGREDRKEGGILK